MNQISKIVGRWFFALVRRRPLVFAACALTGLCIGLWLLSFFQTGDWALGAIGVTCVVFYAGALLLLILKLRAGTWIAFCDWAESLFSQPGSISPARVVMNLNAQVRALPCPRCKQTLGNNRPGTRTFKQILWGGWTCPNCGCDVDRHGGVRTT